jgi:hypothetical protein
MDIIVDKGCGVDVHKGTVVACIMGTGIKKGVKTYTTMTNDLLRLREWRQYRQSFVDFDALSAYVIICRKKQERWQVDKLF